MAAPVNTSAPASGLTYLAQMGFEVGHDRGLDADDAEGTVRSDKSWC
jgi:hypothetical protein